MFVLGKIRGDDDHTSDIQAQPNSKAKDIVPEPPMPWNAWKKMLMINELRAWNRTSQPDLVHSCVVIWAAPHASEATMKRTIAIDKQSFRPRMSLALAQMIRKPEETLFCDRKRGLEWLLTGVGVGMQ